MAELLVKHFFPQNESFGFEALRAAGYANIGAADIGEIIYICSRIPQTDEDAWLREWHAAGDRATTRAENSLQTGNKSSARDSYLRAANYYRTAEFYRRTKPDEDTLAKELSRQSADSFYKAADLMPHCIEKVQIPYEDTLLPGTLFRPDDSKTPRPTLVVNGGYDSTREEAGWQFASTGLDLGFNVLAFDGPGQGEVIREQKLVFRPDWEAVVTPVMDYLLAQPYVAKDKVALLGISMGGYLVARAAAFEHRFAAVILDDGLFDFGCVYRDNTPWPGKMMLHYGWDDLFNYATRQFIRGNTGKIWGLNNGMWTFGTDSLADVGRIGAQYTLEGVVDKIKTPTLVLDAPDDHFMGGQPQMVFDALTCEKKFVSLSREDGGSAHCAVGAVGRMNQVLFDYLLPRFGMDALNDNREQFCTHVTAERKYYKCKTSKQGATWIKRSLRPAEWQQHNGYIHVPLFNRERVLNEGACLRYLAENTTIPLPKLHACFEDDGAAYLITEHVQGITMGDLDAEKQQIVAKELQGHMDTLATLKSNKWGGFVDLVIPPWRIMCRSNGRPWRMRPREHQDLVFCHNDLSANNVIVNPETLKIAAIIDWEYSGFFPPEFEVPYFRRPGPSVPLEGEHDDVDALLDVMAKEKA